jgi:AcrR family transcriptional regulator
MIDLSTASGTEIKCLTIWPVRQYVSHTDDVTSTARPQAVRSREAILRAVADLIATEGPIAITHQRVADHAGVGRATVYRHWPQITDLLNDALARVTLPFLEPAPGPLIERITAELQRIARDLNTASVTALAATILNRAQHDSDTRRLRDRLAAANTANLAVAVEQAVATGELRTAPAIDDLFDQLLGPLFARRLISGKPITDNLVRRVSQDTFAPWLT